MGTHPTTPPDSRSSVYGAMGWVSNTTHPRHIAAMRRPCPICAAPTGTTCRNPFTPGQPPPGRLLHHARHRPDLGDP